MKTIKITELENMSIDEMNKCVEWYQHVDIKEQLAMARLLAENLIVKDEDDLYKVNKNEQLICTNVAFVSLYTNIELVDDDYYNFDVIRKFEFGDMHYEEYMLFDELVQNEIDAYLSQNTLEHIIAHSMGKILFTFDDTMDHVNGMLDKGDPNKIAKYLSKGIEMMANKLPDFSKMSTEHVVSAIKKDA